MLLSFLNHTINTMYKKYIFKLVFYILCAFVPFALWTLGEGTELIFYDSIHSLLTLGKAAGILGLCFFAGNLILSGRYHILDRWAFGLDQLYRFHRHTGILATSLLSFHAVAILAQPLQFSFSDFFRSILYFNDLAIALGKISYLGLIAIITMTIIFSGKMPYEYVKKIHRFLGAFLFIGGLHAFIIPSDISKNIPLRYYVFGLVLLSLISYISRTVLRKWLVPRTLCEVIEVNWLSENVTEIVMKPVGGKKLLFSPGQFIFIQFQQNGFPQEEHPFSLTSSPKDNFVRISAKHIGDFTKKLPLLKNGALAKIQGPYGGFSFLHSRLKNQIWIAGGIGVTPFVSMARSLEDSMGEEISDYDIVMIYSVQNPHNFVYKNELEQISRKASCFSFIPWVSEDSGYLSAEAIKKFTDITNKEIFICGPKPMMLSLISQFKARGIPLQNIHFEFFRLL